MTIDKGNKAGWAGRPLDERMAYMGKDFHVSHPDFVRAMVEIKKGVVRCEQTCAGSGLLVLAPTGAGKSYLRNYLKKLWPRVDDVWTTSIPVLDFQIPKVVNKSRMTKALLQSTGAPIPSSRQSDPYEQLVLLVQKLKTRVIVIDNVHDIPARRSQGGIKEIGDWIRDLIDDSKCLVVLLGAPSALALVNLNPQLRRRGTPRIEMDYFGIETTANFQVFSKFLKLCDEQLPLADPITWSAPLIKQLYWSTYGVMHNLHGLFVEAIDIAVREETETITQAIFEKALRAQMRDALDPTMNPFQEGGPKRPLDQVGEPFHNWADTWILPAPATQSKANSN